MILSNQYQILCEQPDNCSIGQFVFKNNISSDVVGFVSKVLEDGKIIEITTFDIIDISNLPFLWFNPYKVDAIKILLNICEQDTTIREIWKRASSEIIDRKVN